MAQRKTVVLATGGTIAGTAPDPRNALRYDAAQLSAEQLVAAVPALAGVPLVCEQVAQVDSKDMSHALWHALATRAHQLAHRPDVSGVVITHGTDTLEETAYLLHRVLTATKPVVLTAAMRPANALDADGAQNLLDAVTVARSGQTQGVLVVMDGRVWAGAEVRKQHPTRRDAFDAGDAGPVALLTQGVLRALRPWPVPDGLGVHGLPADEAAWPWVEIITSHAGASARGIAALRAAGVQGLVIAATGNGTLHHALEAALHDAAAVRLPVMVASRCAGGAMQGPDAVTALTPAQARVELLLRLLGG